MGIGIGTCCGGGGVGGIDLAIGVDGGGGFSMDEETSEADRSVLLRKANAFRIDRSAIYE